ncbi:MAG: hypothetical protein ACQ5SW_07940, partial [Sphaerochaetaceae bacterium]
TRKDSTFFWEVLTHKPKKVSWKEEPEFIKAVECRVTCEVTKKKNFTHPGTILRPFQIYVAPKARSEVFVMKKRIYKVYAEVGLTTTQTVRYLSVLDTGAG